MRALVPLAEGFEEIEATTVIDVLRRAGIDVITAGLPGTYIRGSNNIQIVADKKMDDLNASDFDALVLVGGNPGYKNLGKSGKIKDAIQEFDRKGKTIAAICAAPSVLCKAGILNNRKATIYPGMEKDIPRPRGKRLEVDEHIITSQGPGTAMEFSLKIVEKLAGASKAEMIKKQLVF